MASASRYGNKEQSDKYQSRHDRGKENYDKSRDKYSGSWVNDEIYDREKGSIYKTETTSCGSDRSDGHSSLGHRNHVESLVNPLSRNWVFNERNTSLTAISSELPIAVGSNNWNIEPVAAVKKKKTKKHENRSKGDTVIPHQGLILPSNGAIIGCRNTRSRQINPSLRSMHPPKTKRVKPTKANSGNQEPGQRISRSQRRKTSCIVLKKQHPVASVETLSGIMRPEKDGRGKRRVNEANDAQNAVAVKRRRLSSEIKTIKNSNADWHCLNKTIKCQLCKTSPGKSLVSHYVNCHPNNEIFPCRVAPHIADFLRNSTEVHKVDRFMPRRELCNKFGQRCYFCNEIKSFTKSCWVKHMIVHTGYYSYKCTNCKTRFAASTPYHACHKGKIKNRVVKEAPLQFNETDVFAYLCDLCNFVRLEESEMEKHLSCEHEGNVTRKFKKVILLRFPKKEKKNENVVKHTMKTKSRKRSKTAENLDDNATGLLEQSPQKVLEMNVVHSEAFVAELVEDIGLSDHDTMKLMEDTPVNVSEDAECPSRLNNNRANSIAVKFNPRFNSLQVDGQTTSTDTEQCEATSLGRMTGNEGIPIVVTVQANSDYHSVHVTVEETSNENPSSTTEAFVKGKNYVPRKEEYFDQSSNNYESFSLDAREVESVSSIQLPSPSNRNNVGSNDTIVSLEQSISTQGASIPVDDLNKLQKTMTLSDSKPEGQTDSSITTILFYCLCLVSFILVGIFTVLYLLFSFD